MGDNFRPSKRNLGLSKKEERLTRVPLIEEKVTALIDNFEDHNKYFLLKREIETFFLILLKIQLKKIKKNTYSGLQKKK